MDHFRNILGEGTSSRGAKGGGQEPLLFDNLIRFLKSKDPRKKVNKGPENNMLQQGTSEYCFPALGNWKSKCLNKKQLLG